MGPRAGGLTVSTTRKDLLKAHRFQSQRLVAALVSGQPNTPEPALRRIAGATFGGLMVGLIIVAVFGIIGFVSPGGSTSWREPGRVVVEKGSGAVFVMVDETLHPVLNFASARLLTEGGETVTVAASSLAEAPRGATLGIEGAPDLLPEPGALGTTPPMVCTSTTATPPRLTAGVGDRPEGTTLDEDEAVLVQGDDRPVLVWRATRHPVDADVARALGFGQVQATAPAWLNALPQGEPLSPPEIPGLGDPGPDVGDQPTVVGQVFEVSFPSGETGAFVMTSDGIAEVTASAQALLLATPDVASVNDGGQATTLTSFQLPPDRAELALPDLPSTPPSPAEMPEEAGLCVTREGQDAAVVAIEGDLPGARAVPGDAGTAVADRVAVTPGGGSVLRRAGQEDDTFHLVTDTGLRHAVDAASLGFLGYAAEDAVETPSGLLRLLPEGPSLSPQAAATPHVVAPPAPE